MTRTTSAAVYRQIKSEGLLNLRQIQVYDVLIDAGPLTQAEVWRAVRTEYDEKCDKPSISPRFAELAKLGVIAITGKRSCSVTGYKCTVWDVTDKLPVKPEKEQPGSATIMHQGYIIELADGGPWLKNDLTWTPVWDERGVWHERTDAELAIARSLNK